MSKRLPLALAFAALFAAFAWIGCTLHFTTFMLYDDEGYVLLTLRDFGRHGGLYDRIFSQYGPFFYLFYDGVQRTFDFAWSNTSGRWITLVNWLGTATFCALTVHRARGWWPLTLFTLANVFAFLWIMIHEPMHPGSTITLWVALAAWLGFEALRANRMTWFGGIVGALGAALALVKINVGVFLIFSMGAWLLLSGPATKLPALKLALLLLGFLLPVALMRTLLAETWIQVFVAVSGCAVVATLLAIQRPAGSQPATRSTWAWFIGAGLAVTILTCIGLWLRGTSLAALWQGVFIAPLKHPTVYAFPVNWRPGTLAVAFGGLVLTWFISRRPDDVRLQKAVAWTRLTAALLLQVALLPRFAAGQAATSLSYGLPLAGLFAWPLLREGAHRQAALGRAWLAVLLVFQILHAYPVAGSQINWGSFLWIPLMLLGVQEAVEFLFGQKTELLGKVKLAVGGLAVVMIANVLWILGWHAYQYRQNGEFLHVTGAETVQLPEQIASAIRVVTENAQVHADTLFSLPGAYSLNLWSGVKTPTLANVTHWFSLLSPAQQAEMLASLKAAERPMFVVQHNILAALIGTGFRPQSPVLDYVRTNYRRAFAVEGYSVWVRNDRTIAPLSTGTLRTLDSGAQPARVRLELTLMTRPEKIAAIELWNVADAQWHVMTLNHTNTFVDVTPLALDNSATGEKQPSNWPVVLPALMRVGLEFSPHRPLPAGGAMEAVLLDENGRRLGYARILPSNGFALPAFNPGDASLPTVN